ncbi:MAG: hypothetical protein PHO12_02410 [Bacteroidales bacterium]|nr:hypothetical protein [Bacteroidales bacterium]MDD4684202.1 hypothetical protein [Bacteroidales bacterium]
MKRFIILSILLIWAISSVAQVEVIADGRLQTILEQHVTFNEIARTAPGYRIKVGVFTGPGSKQKAFDLREELANRFPDLRAYVFFEEPNFTVKCGDYTSKLNAYGLYIHLKELYPSSVIIRDYINFPVLSKDDLVIPEYYEEESE